MEQKLVTSIAGIAEGIHRLNMASAHISVALALARVMCKENITPGYKALRLTAPIFPKVPTYRLARTGRVESWVGCAPTDHDFDTGRRDS